MHALAPLAAPPLPVSAPQPRHPGGWRSRKLFLSEPRQRSGGTLKGSWSVRCSSGSSGSDPEPASVRRVRTLGESTYAEWSGVVELLRASNMRTIGLDECQQLMQNGAVLVDVRTEEEFDRLHAEGSVWVPLFVPLDGELDDSYSKLRKAVWSLLPALGKPTEQNPDFVEEVGELRAGTVILMCGEGGSTGTYPMAGGSRSRSLVAAYELVEAGFDPSKILHLRGGFGTWTAAELGCCTVL